MPKDLLSDAKIRTAKPDAKPYKLSDGGGLFLLIQPSGSKLWRWKFRLNGKENLFVDFRAILTPVFHPILTPPFGV